MIVNNFSNVTKPGRIPFSIELYVQGKQKTNATLTNEKRKFYINSSDFSVYIPFEDIYHFKKEEKDSSAVIFTFGYGGNKYKILFRSRILANEFERLHKEAISKNFKLIYERDSDNDSSFKVETFNNTEQKLSALPITASNWIGILSKEPGKLFEFTLIVELDGAFVSYQEISPSFYHTFDPQDNSFYFSIYRQSRNIFDTYHIQFKSKKLFEEFMHKYVYAENLSNKSKDTKINEKEFKNISVCNNMASQAKINEPEILLDENEDDSNISQRRIADEFHKAKKAKNKHLLMDKDSIFITRGSSLGIFDHSAKFRTHIINAFEDPEKLVKFKDDIVIREGGDNQKELKLLDLEKGEVVEKWDLDRNVKDCFKQTDETLCGINDNSLFQIDPRTSEKVVLSKTYKTKVNFTVGLANPNNGHVVVTNYNGDIRLYDNVSKNAKTLIHGFGDSATGIDTSKDGSWLAVTYSNYILFYDLKISNYKNRVDKTELICKKLQLRPQDVGYFESKNHKFTEAKFDTNNKYIVTSFQNYIFKWRISDILEGNTYLCSHKALSTHVVDENFVVNGEDVVVALPDDVMHVKKNELVRKF